MAGPAGDAMFWMGDMDDKPQWVPENAAIPAGNDTLGPKKHVYFHKLAFITSLELDYVSEATFDLEGYLVRKFAKCFGKAEEDAFINGSGNSMPKGILHDIYTFDSKGELLITIMSSLAQEESRSISENVTWGQRKRFADGKVTLPYSSFLGYCKGLDGLPEIVPEEAETVREIYRLFIQGKTVNWIANHLTAKGIPTPRGKSKWQTSTIESILTNEKYKGSAILQKKFTVDFLSKKMKVNEGEVPQYIVEQSHPAIIDPEQWQKVQDEMAVRKAKGRHHNSLSPFSAKLVCGDCGEYYGSKVWHSTDKYRRVIWQCNGKFKGERRCGTPHLTEEDIKRLFLQAVARLTEEREVLLETCVMLRDEYLNTDAIDAECAALTDEMEIVEALTKKLIAENATTAMPQEEYNRKYDALAQRYHTAEEKAGQLQRQKVTKRFQADVMECFMTELMTIDASLPVHYSDRLWLNLVDRVTVYEDGNLGFHFKNGMEITEML